MKELKQDLAIVNIVFVHIYHQPVPIFSQGSFGAKFEILDNFRGHIFIAPIFPAVDVKIRQNDGIKSVFLSWPS